MTLMSRLWHLQAAWVQWHDQSSQSQHRRRSSPVALQPHKPRGSVVGRKQLLESGPPLMNGYLWATPMNNPDVCCQKPWCVSWGTEWSPMVIVWKSCLNLNSIMQDNIQGELDLMLGHFYQLSWHLDRDAGETWQMWWSPMRPNRHNPSSPRLWGWAGRSLIGFESSLGCPAQDAGTLNVLPRASIVSCKEDPQLLWIDCINLHEALAQKSCYLLAQWTWGRYVKLGGSIQITWALSRIFLSGRSLAAQELAADW